MGRCRAVRGRPGAFPGPLGVAIGALFADPDFQVSRDGFEQFLTLQRWLAAIFGATPFGHADHVIAALAGATPARGGGLALGPGDLLKYCVLCLPDSELDVPLDALWAHDARAAAGLCIAQLAARQMVTPSACARRETMLRWLPRRLAQLPDLRGQPCCMTRTCIAAMRWRRTSTTSSARSTACCASGCWPTDSTTCALIRQGARGP